MRIVICGAGIAGLTLANRLSVLGVDVVVLERSPGPRLQGYMIDFFGPGYDTAEAMGRSAARHLGCGVSHRGSESRGRRRAPPRNGATFAMVEMRVVLREVLRRLELSTTTAADERQKLKHITLVPHRGARIRVRSSGLTRVTPCRRWQGSGSAG